MCCIIVILPVGKRQFYFKNQQDIALKIRHISNQEDFTKLLTALP
jgi:hypothetical protein